MSEAFTVADMLSTIVLGVGIVFVILIILYLIMLIQHKVINALEGVGKHAPETAAASAPAQAAAPAPETISDEETAVVLAVIAACLRCDPSALRLLSLERK